MELSELIQRIDLFTNALEKAMPAISDEIALNAIALVKNRIIDRREGIQDASYSTKPMLATKSQFVVKSAFKQSVVVTEVALTKEKKNKRKGKTTISVSRVKKKKTKLWIKFPGAKSAVPVMLLDNGYREFREIQGRPGDHVNASLTGKMWQGTTIVGRVRQGNTWVTIIGGSNVEAANKLKWTTDHFGQFLAVNDEEQKKLSALYNDRLQAIYNTYFPKS